MKKSSQAVQTKELQKKLLFTAMILVLYRFGTHIPLPYIDPGKITEFTNMIKSGAFGMFNMLSGGSMARISIFALSIMPYITSSIIVQLFVATTPSLKQMKAEGGEHAQKKINFYTKIVTAIIGMLQGYMLSSGFVSMGLYLGSNTAGFQVISALIMTCSTMILLWAGEICSVKGIGNGISLIIFTGIIAESPRDLINIFKLSIDGNISQIMLLGVFAIFIATIFFTVICERSSRLIAIQYPRQSYNPMMATMNMPKQNFLPLKLNNAGVVPPIFASALLLFPVTLLSFTTNPASSSKIVSFLMVNLTHGKLLFMTLYAITIIFFTFFYNNVIFETDEIANNLKKGGVFIPGYRPGKPTSELLKTINNRLALIGGLYLCILCLMPEALSPIYGYSFMLGGTAILIIVNVIIDTTVSIQTALLYTKYEKTLKKYKHG